MTNVYLKRGRWKPLRYGHPWVFSGAIHRVEEPGDDVVEVFGDQGDSLGWGVLSEQSDIRVRMLGPATPFWRERSPSETPELGADAFAAIFADALDRRRNLGLPSVDTTTFRWFNAEGDGLGGLVGDVYGDELVTFQISTAPLHRRREAITDAIARVFGDVAILERPAPTTIARLEGFEPTQGWATTRTTSTVEVREHGVGFLVDPDAMQKTGHYADMREHRAWIGARSASKRVLDAYSYTGGFALHALAGGAAEATAIDSSADAITGADANAALNGFPLDAQVSDVGDFLRSAYDREVRYDVVILDPPKLAPSRKHVKKALKVYESISVQAGRLVEPGGLLCIGSCSEAIGIDELLRVCGAVSARLERAAHVVRAGGQPEDHPYPAAMTEGAYLAFVAVQLG